MITNMNARINRMFMIDAIFAFGFVGVLWCVVLFVFLHIGSIVGEGAVKTVLMIAGGLVLFFNTAAIVAMVRHYSHEKKIIYEIDILHLDEMRAARKR